ncbi:RAMP superfamily protein [compost metagenome]
MKRNSAMYFIHCLSPVHVGTGQGLGDIDMPIIRERTTEWPYLPGSGIKGVKRRHYQHLAVNGEGKLYSTEWVNAVFGKSADEARASEDEMAESIAGALVLSDGRMLAFPVASLNGVFAYVTCPLALSRMIRDGKAVGLVMKDPGLDHMETHFTSNPQSVYVCESSKLWAEPKREVWLDEFKFEAIDDLKSLNEWATWCAEQLFPENDEQLERKNWSTRLAVVSDEAFHYFVTMCSEVTPRIRIHAETKTVIDGALWVEEYIPTEALLYGVAWCDQVYTANSRLKAEDIIRNLEHDTTLQIGGNTGVGKGRVRYVMSKEANNR